MKLKVKMKILLIISLMLESCAFQTKKVQNNIFVEYKYKKWVSGVERVKY